MKIFWLLLSILVLAACQPPITLDGQGNLNPSQVSVMGLPSLSDNDIIRWYYRHAGPNVACYAATVPLDELIRTFIQEGVHEGVRGDVAFFQSIVETGWFCWPGGSVRPEYNNFAGLGATDSNPMANRFATARQGIRAQMQHLRRYADPAAQVCGDPCYDVRFHLVEPPGKASYWNQFGFGIWASSRRTNPSYAESILFRFQEALREKGT